MKSVLFLIESLDGGGAEHILEMMIPQLNPNKYNYDLISEEECPNSSVPHRYFFKRNTKNNPLLKVINKVIVAFSLKAPESLVSRVFIHKKHDIEIAFCEGNATKLIGNSKRKNTKKIAWVHTDVINNPWSEKVFGSAEAEKKCYENFDAIVCVSKTMKEAFIKKYGMQEKVHVLYNVIDIKEIISKMNEKCDLVFNKDTLNFIMVGRLQYIKGFDRMLDAVKRLHDEKYDFSLSIIGRGPELKCLQEKVNDCGINNMVRFLGFQDNPYKFVSKCDAYICSSYAEGYSTTATEAVVLGVPVITTDVSGMREIFGDKECGIICENSTDGLYNALKTVLDNPELLKKYSANAIERAKDFDVNKRIAAVEDFLDSI